MRRIDADHFRQRVEKCTCNSNDQKFHLIWNYLITSILEMIDEEPTAENIGHWERFHDAHEADEKGHYWSCSNCGYIISDRYGLYDHCPECGAYMGKNATSEDIVCETVEMKGK